MWRTKHLGGPEAPGGDEQRERCLEQREPQGKGPGPFGDVQGVQGREECRAARGCQARLTTELQYFISYSKCNEKPSKGLF